jgi:hypothetical protein
MAARSEQFAAQDYDRLSAEMYALSTHAHLDDPTTRRGLVGHELVLPDASAPEGAETTVGRARDWVLVDAGSRREKPGDEIIAWRAGKARDDESSGRDFPKPGEIRLEVPYGCFAVNLH